MDAAAVRLKALLETRGGAWPGPVEHLVEAGSTSDVLRERERSGAPEWTVVIADRQTAGRGRQGRSWHSPPGNVYLSLLLRPAPLGQAVGLLPLAAGVAVAEALVERGAAAAVKWPNDVLVAEKKIAGVLAEGCSGPAGIDSVVLGIGVNLSLDPRAVPADLAARTTSLREVSGRAEDPLEVAAAVLARLSLWYDALAHRGPGPVLEAWRRLAVPWWGRLVEVESSGTKVRGVARGVDERGALLLETPDGRLRPVFSGEARELRLS